MKITNIFLYFYLFIILIATSALACPNCPASTDKNRMGTFFIISIFVGLSYIPLFLIYKKAFDKRKR